MTIDRKVTWRQVDTYGEKWKIYWRKMYFFYVCLIILILIAVLFFAFIQLLLFDILCGADLNKGCFVISNKIMKQYSHIGVDDSEHVSFYFKFTG